MGMRMSARLAALDLPPQFSYKPYIPRKRKSVTATATGVVTQSANPVIVHGDGTLAWTCKAAYPGEFQSLFNIFNESVLTELTFLGYWGESLQVFFETFDPPTVQGRIFDLSGMFQVVAVNTPYSAACGPIE